jgi:predicted transcriptional regulator
LSICRPPKAFDGDEVLVEVVTTTTVANRSTRCRSRYGGGVDRRSPGELEAEVLTALWAAKHSLTAAEVRAAVGSGLAETTIMTILARLVRKELAVRSRVEGERVYRYAPASEHSEHVAGQMHAFLATSGDRRAVLARFLGQLSAADRRAAADLLRRRRS